MLHRKWRRARKLIHLLWESDRPDRVEGGLPIKKRHTPEQIVRKLREAEAKLATGASVPQVARDLGISEATYHRWRNRYGGMNPSETKRLKDLEKENIRLKKLVAEQALDIDLLKEVNRGNFWARSGEEKQWSTYSTGLRSPSVGLAK
jgi:putative transposase